MFEKGKPPNDLTDISNIKFLSENRMLGLEPKFNFFLNFVTTGPLGHEVKKIGPKFCRPIRMSVLLQKLSIECEKVTRGPTFLNIMLGFQIPIPTSL